MMARTRQELAAIVEATRSDDLHQSLTYHSWVSRDHKYVCMTIPKVACSTVKFVLQRLAGHDDPEFLANIHDQGLHLVELGTDEIVEALTSPDWLRFGFVRNPYDRLFSAYKSKIGNMREKQYVWVQNEIRERCDYPRRDGTRTGMVAFRDFVRWVRDARGWKRRDGHWNRQADILMQSLIPYDFIGRFETLVADFTSVLTRLGASDEVVKAASTVLNPTVKVPLAAAYDRDLADCVYAMYEQDFEEFGYDRDSWTFPAT
jgi:hypothetical protein